MSKRHGRKWCWEILQSWKRGSSSSLDEFTKLLCVDSETWCMLNAIGSCINEFLFLKEICQPTVSSLKPFHREVSFLASDRVLTKKEGVGEKISICLPYPWNDRVIRPALAVLFKITYCLFKYHEWNKTLWIFCCHKSHYSEALNSGSVIHHAKRTFRSHNKHWTVCACVFIYI